jgi:hypothetical protein
MEQAEKKQKTTQRATVTVRRKNDKGSSSSSSDRKEKKHKPAVMHIGYLSWEDGSQASGPRDFLRMCERELALVLNERSVKLPEEEVSDTKEEKPTKWIPEAVKRHFPIKIVSLDMMGLKGPKMVFSATDFKDRFAYSTEDLSKFDMEWIRRKQETKSYEETGTTRTEFVEKSSDLKKPLLDLWYIPAASGTRFATKGTDPRRDLQKARERRDETVLFDGQFEVLTTLLEDSPLGKAGRVFQESPTASKRRESERTPSMIEAMQTAHDELVQRTKEGQEPFGLVFRTYDDFTFGPLVYLEERAELHYDTRDSVFSFLGADAITTLNLWYNTIKKANDAFAQALFDHHPELQAERLATLFGERRVYSHECKVDVTVPGMSKALAQYTKTFMMGKTDVKDETKKTKKESPRMHIGVVTFDDKIRDDLAAGLLTELLSVGLTARLSADKDGAHPDALNTRFHTLVNLGLKPPEFRFGKYSWQAQELQDFDATWIQRTKKPSDPDQPPEIHAWIYGTSISGPGNSISKFKGEETRKVLAGLGASEQVTSPTMQGGNPFFAPALVASLLVDSPVAVEGRLFRLESSLARKLITQSDRLDSGRPLDLQHEIKESGVDNANSVLFIGQLSLMDNKFTGMNGSNKYTLIEKTTREGLASRLNNMKTTRDKKNGNALLELQAHHARVAEALVRLHPAVIAYEAARFLRDANLMDTDSRSVLSQFFGKASDFARHKADRFGDLVSETASLPAKALEQTPGQFVKTTTALPLSATRVLVSGRASVGGEEVLRICKHTCGWDTEDENIRAHLAPGYWDIMHRMTAEVHRDERKLLPARIFLLWVAENFPCESCRVKFTKSLSNPPIETVPKEKLFEHLVEIHNGVNRERGECEYPLERAKKRYKYVED